MDTKGKVITVLGSVEPSALGKTLCHEHVSITYGKTFKPPSTKDREKAECDFSLPNIGWIRQNPYSHRKNLQLYGTEVEEHIREELNQFKAAGGGCIVENTTVGIQRDIQLIKKLSEQTGVAMVAGTGHYVDQFQSASSRGLSVEEMALGMRTELMVGCLDFPEVRCGIIGEIGTTWPITEFERRSVAAAGSVQESLGCPVMFHPGRHHLAPSEIIRIFAEAGGSVDKAVMAHLDRTLHTKESLLEFADLGGFLEFDHFGIETSYYQLNSAEDMPSDAQRIQRIKWLLSEGFGEKLLISHDIHTRHRLTAYGGHGLCHILDNVVPKMLGRGISEAEVENFLVHNPQNWLCFNK